MRTTYSGQHATGGNHQVHLIQSPIHSQSTFHSFISPGDRSHKESKSTQRQAGRHVEDTRIGTSKYVSRGRRNQLVMKDKQLTAKKFENP